MSAAVMEAPQLSPARDQPADAQRRCKLCHAAIAYSGRGRPPEYCGQPCDKTLAYEVRHDRAEIAAKKRAYREENRAEIAAKQRAYYEENRAEIAAKKRAYREENRAEIAAKKRAYYEENRAEIAAKKRAYYEENRAEIAAKKRAYREENRAEIAAKQRARRECAVCGERMRRRGEDGLCGFCREEMG